MNTKGTIYICGMASEAAIIGNDPSNLVIISAGNRTALGKKLGAISLDAAACYGQVVSFGVCGGLNPVMRSGDRAHTVVGSAQVISSVADRAAVFATTKADGVDNESDIAEAFALNRNLPFFTQRVVLDTADETLPPAALIPLNDDGTPNVWAIAKSVLTKWQLPELMRLWNEQSIAKAALKVLRWS